MASDNAIYAVAKTILGLIEDHCPAALDAKFFEFYHPSTFSTPPDSTGFSLTLYRVSVNASARNLPARRDAAGRQLRPSLPLDLHYLLTPWSPKADMQQLMMGWVMRFLEDRSVLPAGILNSYVPGSFRPEEGLELVCDPLPLADYFNLWEQLKPGMQTSITYVARMVLLDSTLEMAAWRDVQAREQRVITRVPE